MMDHAIDLETHQKLIALEAASNYDGCRVLLSRRIESFNITDDPELNYEYGAAYLRLAIYCQICGDLSQHTMLMSKAIDILPKTDVYALAAQWLHRSGASSEKIQEYCVAYFKVIHDADLPQDEISQNYYKTMMELRMLYEA